MAPTVHQRTVTAPRPLSLIALRNRFADAVMRRGIMGWGNAAWPGGEAKSLRQRIARLVPGDAERAQEMYAARFGRGERDALGQLGWLKHFNASGKALHALYAIELIHKWSAQELPSLKGGDAARSLMALVIDGYSLAAKGPKSFGTEYFRTVTTLARKTYAWPGETAEDKLLRAVALCCALTSTSGLEALRPRVRDALEETVPLVVLPDGGHVDGNPESLLRLLLQLVPLRSGMQAAREPITPALTRAIERMLPMLRMLRNAQGELAALRGSAPHAEITGLLLEGDETAGAPLTLARHSGFARLECSDTLVVADTTALTGFTAEISIGTQSVLTTSHVNLAPPRGLSTESPADVLELDEGLLFMTSVRLRNLNHSRHLFVSSGGHDIRAEESAYDTDRPLTVSFDLRTGATGLVAADGASADIMLASGGRWRLAQRGGVLKQSQGGRQILAIAAPANGSCAIAWALQRC